MKQSLSFKWHFIDRFEEPFLKALPKDAKLVDIPHNIKDVPYNYFNENDYQKVVTYEKLFDVEENIENKSVVIRFEGYMLQADIYLNDVFIGHYASGYVPVPIDVTNQIKQKGNRLVVVLDTREDKEIPPFGYAVDYLTFSGIYREVTLEVLPKTYLQNFWVYGDMKGNTYVGYDKKGNDKISIVYQVYNKDGYLVHKGNNDKFNIKGVDLWDVDNPNLYKIVATTSNGQIIERKYGYRDAKFTNKGFFLNDKPLKLLGLNRHQLYPYVGGAMPKSMQIDDAIKLKELGINIVRTSHYPQSEWFLDKCDELGLLVVDEIPGWQHLGKSTTWRGHYYDFIKRMVLKERGHTSLIAYGVRVDESQDDHELYTNGNNIAHSFDPYRPTLGVRNFKNSELLEDIYGYNDFVCADMSKGLIDPKSITKHKDAPILITEYMGHMEPVKGTSDLDKRKVVALRHARVIDDSNKYERLSGCIGWCFVDYYTHVDFGSGDHICPHGVLDMFRNKKYTASIYESQQDEHPVLDVLSNMRPGDFKEATYQDIYVATNVDRVDLYKNDEFATSFYPKRDRFKYMKHPPILIDDVLGETFKDDRFTEKECKKLAKAFSYGGLYGFNHLKLNHIINVGMVYLKYKLKWSDLVDIWNTHVATWGGYAKTFTFKGIKDDQVVIEKTIAPSLDFHYEYKVNRNELKEEETYDVTTINVSFVDPDGNVMPYANRPIQVKAEGDVAIIGPELQTLLGGQLTVYVRSLRKGKGIVTITDENGDHKFEFKVV